MVQTDPSTDETLGWRRRIGLRVERARAQRDDVKALLRAAWQRMLPQRA